MHQSVRDEISDELQGRLAQYYAEQVTPDTMLKIYWEVVHTVRGRYFEGIIYWCNWLRVQWVEGVIDLDWGFTYER